MRGLVFVDGSAVVSFAAVPAFARDAALPVDVEMNLMAVGTAGTVDIKIVISPTD